MIDEAQLAGSNYKPGRSASQSTKAIQGLAWKQVIGREKTAPTYADCLAAAMNWTHLERAHLSKVMLALNESEDAAILDVECRRLLDG